MGKGAAKKSEGILTEGAERMADLSEELIRETKPYRRQVGSFYSDVISGDREKRQQVTAAGTEAIRGQYSKARESIRRFAPRGGGMSRAMAETFSAEAGDVGRLQTGKIDEYLARLAAFSTFGTQAGISSGQTALGAGGALADLSAQRGAAFAGGVGGIAGSLGTYFGLKG